MSGVSPSGQQQASPEGAPASLDANVLLVTASRSVGGTLGGRAQLSSITRLALMQILGNRLTVFEVAPASLRRWEYVAAGFTGRVDGVGPDLIPPLLAIVDAKGCNKVVLDGSNLGYLARRLKRARPATEVISLFHNCEARFFYGAMKHYRSLRSVGVLVANFIAERWAVRHSDKRVCLNQRDSDQLRSLYGRAATHLAPMALQAGQAAAIDVDDPARRGDYLLFVGGAFYANQDGIRWYARHVASHLSVTTCVVGMGMEPLKEELASFKGIEVIGAVDDLSTWYRDARFVVAPIFDGSGMKTKVAEALMHGKRVVGTSEAFTGYEDVVDHAGISCETAPEFVAAIQQELLRPFVPTDGTLRGVFDRHYSLAALRSRWSLILEHAVVMTERKRPE